MRKIVVTEFISLDGVVEDPGGSEGSAHGAWTFDYPSAEGYAYKLDEVMTHDAHLLGRVTYEGFAAAWPDRDDPQGFAARINSMTKYVVSTTLEEATWQNSTIVRGDVAAEIAALKREPGQDILVAGSVTLVRFLLEHDLVDELRLMVFPIVLGSGLRLFADRADAIKLELASSRQLDTGTMILTYHPDRA